MDFQTDYDQLTKKIDDTLKTQVSATPRWSNISGQFKTVVSSVAGYVWGINDKVFICQEPCDGNWKEVEISKTNKVIPNNIVVDDSNVYLEAVDTVEKKHYLFIKPVSGNGEWRREEVPINRDPFGLFITSTYVWLQYFGQNSKTFVKYKCAKPCTGGSWIKAKDDSVMLTSSTYNQLYGMDVKTRKNVKSDENIVSGWAPLSLGGDDKKGNYILGRTTTADFFFKNVDGYGKNLYTCKEGNCDTPEKITVVDTQGYTPDTLSVEPNSNSMWMTTFSHLSSEDKGNVFTRSAIKDQTTILNTIDPLDKQRDEIVKDATKEYTVQTNTMTTNKQIQNIVDFFQKFFGYNNSVKKDTENQASALTDNIQKSQQKIDKMTSITSKLLILIVTLAVAAIIYLLAEPLIGIYVHYITVIALGIGIFFTVYY